MGSRSQAASSTQLSGHYTRATSRLEALAAATLPPPPPIVCNGIKEYKVEKIPDSQILHGKVEYLVHWKGYGVEEDEWRPIRDVQGSKQLVAKFHRTHPQAPCS